MKDRKQSATPVSRQRTQLTSKIAAQLPEASESRGATRGIIIGLVAVTLLAYWPLLTADFTNWDDQETLAKNNWLNPPSLSHFAEFWNPRKPFMDIWIPMTYTVWSGLAAIAYVPTADPETSASLNPWVFHGANLAVHLCSVLLVFSILRRLTSKSWPAAAGAALFALHPMQVEAVGWLSGMKDLLCGVFSLLAVDQYILFAQSRPVSASKSLNQTAPPASTLPLVVATTSCLLAMLSKPAGVVLPLIVGVLDLVLLRKQFKPAFGALWPWFVFAVLIAAEGRFAQPAHNHLYVTPVIFRPLIAADALAFYLYKLVAPVRLGITYNRAPNVALREYWAYFTWIAPAIVGLLVWIWRRRFSWLLAVVGVSFTAVFSVLGLVPFDFQDFSTVADHYFYVAMLGPAIAVAFALRGARKRWVMPLCLIVLTALGTRSWFQCWTWKNSISLYSNAIVVNPQECAGYNNLASALQRQNQIDKAIATFEEGLRHTPQCLPLHLNLAPLLANRGQFDKAENHFLAAQRLAIGKDAQTAKDGLAKIRQMRKEHEGLEFKKSSKRISQNHNVSDQKCVDFA